MDFRCRCGVSHAIQSDPSHSQGRGAGDGDPALYRAEALVELQLVRQAPLLPLPIAEFTPQPVRLFSGD